MKKSDLLKEFADVISYGRTLGKESSEIAVDVLDHAIERGMLAPKATIKNGNIETTDYFWEPENG